SPRWTGVGTSEAHTAGQVGTEEAAELAEDVHGVALHREHQMHGGGPALGRDLRHERGRLGAKLVGLLLGGNAAEKKKVGRLVEHYEHRARPQAAREARPRDPRPR